ncbi:unnamed protein product [Paramecium octaurelia]|uniref:Uncharacterized protein n=1 Tax=Paramecium octaurelia TaxID=43137 RepID=A0A8S1SYY0_PAROT|nr:unnamed protein product [Paramecium octaurelia]
MSNLQRGYKIKILNTIQTLIILRRPSQVAMRYNNKSKSNQKIYSEQSLSLQVKFDERLKQKQIYKNQEIQMIRNRLEGILKVYRIENQSQAIQCILEQQSLNQSKKQNQNFTFNIIRYILNSLILTYNKTLKQSAYHKLNIQKLLYQTSFLNNLNITISNQIIYSKIMDQLDLARMKFIKCIQYISLECTQILGMTKVNIINIIMEQWNKSSAKDLSIAPKGTINQLFNLCGLETSWDLKDCFQIKNLITTKKNQLNQFKKQNTSFEEICQNCNMIMEQIMKIQNRVPCTQNLFDIITKKSSIYKQGYIQVIEFDSDEEISTGKLRLLIGSQRLRL